jgi:malate dehydrogenase (oxaloacetate-decarboxylating)(NADP+)
VVDSSGGAPTLQPPITLKPLWFSLIRLNSRSPREGGRLRGRKPRLDPAACGPVASVAMADSRTFSEALEYHEHPRPGKLEIRATKPTATQADLSLAYTPGVAEPCRVIADDPEAGFRFTNRANLVAVVSNGTAVLGLGNIGPLASKPVMEGKAVLFKRFADIDVFDLEVDAEDPADVIRFCEMLAPTVGGINLEDIKAPDCFEIEQTLRERLDIPVFHDDQHGTAIIAGAGFLNALALTNRQIEETRVVFSGREPPGSPPPASSSSWVSTPSNVLLCDSKGRHPRGARRPHPDQGRVRPFHRGPVPGRCPGRRRCLRGGLGGRHGHQDMVRSMAADPIVFALANPDPEITYEDATAARPTSSWPRAAPTTRTRSTTCSGSPSSSGARSTFGPGECRRG